MQQSNSVVRIERTSTHENAEYFINNKRKGDKRNKTKRGGGYKGNFFSTPGGKFDVNLMC